MVPQVQRESLVQKENLGLQALLVRLVLMAGVETLVKMVQKDLLVQKDPKVEMAIVEFPVRLEWWVRMESRDNVVLMVTRDLVV